MPPTLDYLETFCSRTPNSERAIGTPPVSQKRSFPQHQSTPFDASHQPVRAALYRPIRSQLDTAYSSIDLYISESSYLIDRRHGKYTLLSTVKPPTNTSQSTEDDTGASDIPTSESAMQEARKQVKRAFARAYGTMVNIDADRAAELKTIGEGYWGVEDFAKIVDQWAELSNASAQSSLAMAYAEFMLLHEDAIADKLEKMGREQFGHSIFGDAMAQASSVDVGLYAPGPPGRR